MVTNRLKSIIENPILSRKIVYAINKAVTQDIPQNNRENRLETNNRNRFAAGDFINENLRQHVVKGAVDLIPFKRYAWEGRIIVDRENKITYTIVTHRTLHAIIKKHRNQPHYLMTLLSVENGDCEGSSKQMTLGEFVPDFKVDTFKTEVLEEDFDKIMQGSVSRTDGYKHYIIAYTYEQRSIIRIELLLLDKDFDFVDRLDLMEYVVPDFASLTDSEYEESEKEEAEQEARPFLLKLREGVKTTLNVMKEKS